MKKISVEEFLKEGYLVAANREFFHPLGLALEVTYNDQTKEYTFSGIWDERDDDEGIYYGYLESQDDKNKREKKLNNIEKIKKERFPKRQKKLGYIVQSIENLLKLEKK